MTDRQTRRNRGFGFVTFEEGSNLTRLLTIQDHYIRGKKCSIRQMKPEGINLTRKVFIGGINPLLGEVELEPYFRTWGALEKVTIMRDLEGNSRGFGFVIFNEEATCKRVVDHRVHAIDTENKVECRQAEARGRVSPTGRSSASERGGAKSIRQLRQGSPSNAFGYEYGYDWLPSSSYAHAAPFIPAISPYHSPHSPQSPHSPHSPHTPYSFRLPHSSLLQTHPHAHLTPPHTRPLIQQQHPLTANYTLAEQYLSADQLPLVMGGEVNLSNYAPVREMRGVAGGGGGGRGGQGKRNYPY
eukprot:GHVN01025962.1.p1 GENE.GHVN01025962.1~~GHVN01025962.1.p1  ORF type:complete len:330 (-),score=80.36 GHVN01025962.1:76-972(-)